MKKLSEELKNYRVAKLRDGRIVLVIRDNDWTECKLINEDTYLCGANYSENGSYTIDRYRDESKNDIVAVYKIDLGSFSAMEMKIKHFDEGQAPWGVEKIWETPDEIEISLDDLLKIMSGDELIEWLMTPQEISDRMNEILENPNNSNNKYFISQLKDSVPILKDAKKFYIEREPGDSW
jgi:hypothetical protein